MDQVLQAAQLGLGALFAVSAWTKLRAPRSFAQAVQNYGVLSRGAVVPAAWAIIAAEALVAAALLTGIAAEIAAAAAAGLLAVFLAAVRVVLRRGGDVSCGCFGVKDELVTDATAARLGLLLAAAAATVAGWSASGEGPLTLAWIADDVGRGIEQATPAAALAAAVALMALWAANAPALRSLWRGESRLPGDPELHPLEGA